MVVVAPTFEAVAFGGFGCQCHCRTKIVGSSAQYGGTGKRRGGGDDGSTRGAPVGIGANTNKGHIVEIVGTHIGPNTATSRFKTADDIIVIVPAGPTPVDMEVTVSVVTIEHEAMSSFFIGTREEDGATLVEFGSQDGSKCFMFVVITGNCRHVGTVFEIFHQGSLRRGLEKADSVIVLCSTGMGTIAH